MKCRHLLNLAKVPHRSSAGFRRGSAGPPDLGILLAETPGTARAVRGLSELLARPSEARYTTETTQREHDKFPLMIKPYRVDEAELR